MNTEPRSSNDSSHERVAGWFRQHGPAVRGYLLAMVKRTEVADDLLQDVFRKAWEARGRYQETGAARAYLLRIADRLLCDEARRKAREVTRGAAAVEEHEDPGGVRPAEAAEMSEQRRRLNEALKELSQQQRRVLLLRYYGDMSFADIAETIGCPIGTALSHARRGLLALRKRFVEVV